MRWIGLVICVLASLWVIRKAFLAPNVSLLSLVVEPAAAAQLSLCMALALVWLFYFGEKMVRDAAFTYARELIRSCEVIGTATARKAKSSVATKSSTQAQE